jgi:sugar phosphate permease
MNKFEINDEINKKEIKNEEINKEKTFLQIIFSMEVWIALFLGFFSSMTLEIYSFLNIFFIETQNLTPGLSGISTSVYNIGCMFSILIISNFYDNISNFKKLIFLTSFNIVSTIASFLLILFYNNNNLIFLNIFLITITGIFFF